MQSNALQLVEMFANGGSTTAVPLQTADVAEALCDLVTGFHLLPDNLAEPANGEPGHAIPHGSGADDSNAQPQAAGSTAVVQRMAKPLAALRCLRLIVTHESSGGPAEGSTGRGPGFALQLRSAGLYAALTRHLLQAAALALPLRSLSQRLQDAQDTQAPAAPQRMHVDVPREDAFVPEVPCRNLAQVKARQRTLQRLPPPHCQGDSALGAVMAELAMWTGIVEQHGLARAVRADVIAPLCSAVVDCFAFGTGKFVLEQPAANLSAANRCAECWLALPALCAQSRCHQVARKTCAHFATGTPASLCCEVHVVHLSHSEWLLADPRPRA